MTLAVRIVLCKTVAHLTFALHSSITQLGGNHIMQVAEVLGIACPEFAVVYKEVIVVSELVVFLNDTVRIVQVILHLVSIRSISADGISVHVVELCSTEQVLHRLIVHALVGSTDDTDVPSLVLVNLLVESRRKGDVQGIVVFSLDIIHGILSLSGSLLVAVVQAIPVNLAVCLCARPVVVSLPPISESRRVTVRSIGLVPDVIIATWHILPVVRMRVVGIVVVQLRALVHTVSAEHGSCQLVVV